MMIAKTLQTMGCEVSVVCSGDPSLTCYEGIKTVRLPCNRYVFGSRVSDVVELTKGADVIHSFTYHGLYPAYRAARYHDVPIVNTVLALFGDAWITMKR